MPSFIHFTDAQLEAAARATYANTITSFSPYIMGPWFDAVLLGILVVLFIEWMQRGYGTERTPTKILMIYLLLVSLGTTAFVLNCEMENFIIHYGEFKQFLNPRWYRIFWILNVISRVPAATYFAHRAWLITKRSIWIPLSIIPLMIASVACSFAAYFTSAQLPIPRNSPERVLVTAFVVTEVASDLITTITIAVGLFRSRTGWRSTDRLISKVLISFAETQLPPTCAAITFLVVFVGWPNNTIIFAFNGIAKCHVICLLTVVNSRVKFRSEAMENQESHELPSSKRLEISVDSQTQVDEVEDMPYFSVQKKNSTPDAEGQLRSVNGRVVGQQDAGNYKEMNSKTSLV